MNLGNTIIADADLSSQYFGDDSRKVVYRRTCLTMALANLASFFLRGMPLCHGSGGWPLIADSGPALRDPIS